MLLVTHRYLVSIVLANVQNLRNNFTSFFFLTGHTDDFHVMLVDLTKKYRQTKIVAIGFSLGGNLVTKYLGERREHISNLIAGVSVCQGYNAIE